MPPLHLMLLKLMLWLDMCIPHQLRRKKPLTEILCLGQSLWTVLLL